MQPPRKSHRRPRLLHKGFPPELITLPLALLLGMFHPAHVQSQTPSAPTAPLEQDPADSVIVRIVIPTDYQDTRISRAAVGRLMELLPPVRDTLQAGRTYHQLILERYNLSIGPKARAAGEDHEQQFDSISVQIARLNNLNIADNSIPAGVVTLPTLPEKAPWTVSSEESRSYLPTILNATAVRVEADTTQVAEAETTFVLTPPDTVASTRSQVSVMYIAVAEKDAPQLIDQLEPLIADGLAVVTSAPFEYMYGDAASQLEDYVPGPGLLPQTTVDSIATLLARRRVRSNVPLVILESAWPDSTTAAASCGNLLEILRVVRDSFGLGPAEASQCNRAEYRDPQIVHSRDVRLSLQQLAAVGDSAVSITFVPMSRDQGATPVLRELIRVATLLSYKTVALEDSIRLAPRFAESCRLNVGVPATFPPCIQKLSLYEAYRTSARAVAEQAVQRLKPQLVESGIPWEKFTSTSAVLTSLFEVLSAYAQVTDRGAFLSTSWTIPALLSGTFRGSTKFPTVVVVAAAGNERRIINNDIAPVDLGQWATRSSQVLAVVNLNDTGTDVCRSSTVSLDLSLFLRTNVVGFNGDLESRTCGTSFSAPRVAWLLAADEALRQRGRLSVQWSAQIAGRLFQARDSLAPSLSTVLLRPLNFVGNSEN